MLEPFRRRRYVAAAASATALIVAGIVIAHPWSSNATHQQPVAGTAPTATRTPAPTEASPPQTLGPVTLVEGRRFVDGVMVGYPHSTVGAISAASEYLGDVGSTLDPARAAAIMRIVGDPASSDLPAALAHGTVVMREDLQLPAQGTLPAGVSYAAEPQMYQLRDVSANRVMVLLLVLGTFTSADGGMASTTGVFPMHMHWVDGDWRLAHIGGVNEDFSGLDATPGTGDAARAGWAFLEGSAAGSS